MSRIHPVPVENTAPVADANSDIVTSNHRLLTESSIVATSGDNLTTKAMAESILGSSSEKSSIYCSRKEKLNRSVVSNNDMSTSGELDALIGPQNDSKGPQNDSNAGSTPKSTSDGILITDFESSDDNGTSSNNGADSMQSVPLQGTGGERPSLLRKTSAYANKNYIIGSATKNIRKIHFSDEVGEKLTESIYCNNLHYSSYEDKYGVVDPNSTACCVIS